MPGLDGIEATRLIARDAPDVAVLILTMHEDYDSVFAAMRAGARGYLLKGAEQDEIVRAIRAVAAGEAIFGPGSPAASWATSPSRQAPIGGQRTLPRADRPGTRGLDLIAAGHPNSEISRRLGISPKTVANHSSNIFAKLQIATRARAIVRARDAGLGDG